MGSPEGPWPLSSACRGGLLPPCPTCPVSSRHSTSPLYAYLCPSFLWFQGHRSYRIRTHPEDLILT